jgi:hypothetical protein
VLVVGSGPVVVLLSLVLTLAWASFHVPESIDLIKVRLGRRPHPNDEEEFHSNYLSIFSIALLFYHILVLVNLVAYLNKFRIKNAVSLHRQIFILFSFYFQYYVLCDRLLKFGIARNLRRP